MRTDTGASGLSIRQALPFEVGAVRDILREAASWLRDSGRELWREDELTESVVSGAVASGTVFIAYLDGEPAATLQFQLSDDDVWPDVPPDESAFVHRLAIKRRFAGGGLSTALLQWSVTRAASLGRRFLRLDCDQPRMELRAVYERFGFRWHSDRRVGPHFVARYECVVSPRH